MEKTLEQKFNKIEGKIVYKFNNFDFGLSQIIQNGIFATYDNPTAQQGKNFKCEVALDILIETKSASEYGYL